MAAPCARLQLVRGPARNGVRGRPFNTIVRGQLKLAPVKPGTVLIVGISLVALSTVFFPFIYGYGMMLFQLVVLLAWSVVAAVSSGVFADQHHEFIWPIAVLLNVAFFAIVAVPIWLIAKTRMPKAGSVVLVVWTLFYVASLFWLFPATDGP